MTRPYSGVRVMTAITTQVIEQAIQAGRIRHMNAFGTTLRTWRDLKKVSQLSLSSTSGISQRHISFLETGRARPSRPMVLALASSLDVPLRERNDWLLHAGYAPEFGESPLDATDLREFSTALSAMLEHHEPFPAFVLDRRWNPVQMNNGAIRFFSLFLDPKVLARHGGFKIIRTCLEDDGLKPYLLNWEEVMSALLARCRRAQSINPADSELTELVRQIIAHPDAPRRWRDEASSAPVVPFVLEKDGVRASCFTMLAHFGAPREITLDELSLELLFPADDATRKLLITLGEQPS